MAFFQNIFRGGQRPTLEPLYRAIVERGRDPFWYRDGRVPDTLDGRFDMIAALVALVLLRIEAEGEAAAPRSILLTEAFIDDMDASLRQIGVGENVGGGRRCSWRQRRQVGVQRRVHPVRFQDHGHRDDGGDDHAALEGAQAAEASAAKSKSAAHPVRMAAPWLPPCQRLW